MFLLDLFLSPSRSFVRCFVRSLGPFPHLGLKQNNPGTYHVCLRILSAAGNRHLTPRSCTYVATLRTFVRGSASSGCSGGGWRVQQLKDSQSSSCLSVFCAAHELPPRPGGRPSGHPSRFPGKTQCAPFALTSFVTVAPFTPGSVRV